MMRWIIIVAAIPVLLLALVFYANRPDGGVTFTLQNTVATNGGYRVEALLVNEMKKDVHFMRAGSNLLAGIAVEGANNTFFWTMPPTRDGFDIKLARGAEMPVSVFVETNRPSIISVEYEMPSRFKSKIRSGLFWIVNRGNLTYARSSHLSIAAEPPAPPRKPSEPR